MRTVKDISLSRLTYARLKAYAIANGIPIGAVIAKACSQELKAGRALLADSPIGGAQ